MQYEHNKKPRNTSHLCVTLSSQDLHGIPPVAECMLSLQLYPSACGELRAVETQCLLHKHNSPPHTPLKVNAAVSGIHFAQSPHQTRKLPLKGESLAAWIQWTHTSSKL